MSGRKAAVNAAFHGAAWLAVRVDGGTVKQAGGWRDPHLVIENAKTMTVFLSAGTDFRDAAMLDLVSGDPPR